MLETILIGFIAIALPAASLGVCWWLARGAGFGNAMALGQVVAFGLIILGDFGGLVGPVGFVLNVALFFFYLRLQAWLDEQEARRRTKR